MSKKGLFTGLLALLLVFALLGCEQVTSGTKPGSGPGTGASPDDKWTEVNLDEATGFDVFKGKWKSSAKRKQTVENVDYDVTMVQEATYPASGIRYGYGSDGRPIEVEIKDGVRVFSLMNGAPQGEPEYMEIAEFRSRYIQGADVYVNQSKTRIKTERVFTNLEIPTEGTEKYPGVMKPVETDEEWEQFQKQMLEESGGEYSGDMTVTFSAGAPYTMTITQIYHKQ